MRTPLREVYHTGDTPRSSRHEEDFDQGYEDGGYQGYDEWDRRGRHHAPRHPRQQEDGLGRIKVKIPPFEGKCDPDAYMEWEEKIEQILMCHHFLEQRKVQLAAL